MDPIHPITPDAPRIAERLPVQRVERVTREGESQFADGRRRKRRARRESSSEGERGEDDDGRPHIDVCA
jgi:hypothetical protein